MTLAIIEEDGAYLTSSEMRNLYPWDQVRSGTWSSLCFFTPLILLLLLVGVTPCRAWSPAGPWGGVIHDLVPDPANQSTVYVATGNGIYRYEGSLPWAVYPSTMGYRVLASTASSSLGSLFAVATTTMDPFDFSEVNPSGELYSLNLGSEVFTSEGISGVTALTSCGSGDVLAATSAGQVYRFAGDGSGLSLSLSIAGPINALAGRAGSNTVHFVRGNGPSNILVSPNCGAVSGSWTLEHTVNGRIIALGRDGYGQTLAGTEGAQVYARGASGWAATPFGTNLPPYPVTRFSSLPDGNTLAVIRNHNWNFYTVNDGPAGLFQMPTTASGLWTRWTRFDVVSSFISDAIPYGGDLLVSFDYAGVRRAAMDDLLPGVPSDDGIAAVPLERIVLDPLTADRALAVGPGGVYEHESGVWRHHMITTPVSIPSGTLQWIRESGFLSAAFSPDGDGFWVGGNGTGLLRAVPMASGASTWDWYQIYYAALRNVIGDMVPDPYHKERLWWSTSNGVHFTSQANTTNLLTSGQVLSTEGFISHDLDLEIVTEGVYNMVAAAVPGFGFTSGLLASQFVDNGSTSSQLWTGALYGNYTLKAARFFPTRSLSGTTRVLSGVSMNNTLGMVARKGMPWEIDPDVPATVDFPHNPRFRSLEVIQGNDGDGSIDAFAVVSNVLSPAGVYHSEDTLPGAQWSEITGDLVLYNTQPTCVAVDPKDGNLLWVTTERASAFTMRGAYFLDNSPPGFPAGSSLDAVGSTATEIYLMWAAPGDDDSYPGWADRYELRCSDTPLVASGDFPTWGTNVNCGPPRISHSVEVFPIDVPSLGFTAGTIFCALMALDEQGQPSPILTTGPAPPLARIPVTDVSHQASSGGVTISWSLDQLSTDPYFQNFGEIVVEKLVSSNWNVLERIGPTVTQWHESWPGGTYNPGQTLNYRITALDGMENGVPVMELVTVPDPSVRKGGGGGGCFIATAAYGSADESPVRALRAYRDGFLLDRSWGRAIVRAYYAVSPPLARIIDESPVLRAFARMLLMPVNAAVSGSYGQTWFPAVLAMFIIWWTFFMVMFSVAFIIRAIMKYRVVALIPRGFR